jgi:hypothetical protein
MTAWPEQKVRQRVRSVFPEAPDKAVAIADCPSFPDPEWHIQAAGKLWSRKRDFGDRPHCERAADPGTSPAPGRSSPKASTGARPPR